MTSNPGDLGILGRWVPSGSRGRRVWGPWACQATTGAPQTFVSHLSSSSLSSVCRFCCVCCCSCSCRVVVVVVVLIIGLVLVGDIVDVLVVVLVLLLLFLGPAVIVVSDGSICGGVGVVFEVVAAALICVLPFSVLTCCSVC